MPLWKAEARKFWGEPEFTPTHTLTVVDVAGETTYYDVCLRRPRGDTTYEEDPKMCSLWTQIRWESGADPLTWTDTEGYVILRPGWHYATLEANTMKVRVA